MADLEVERTLREIRERVRAETAALEAAPARAHVGGEHELRAGRLTEATRGEREAFAAEALARLDANLATTERAWSKLPPLLSYRRGWIARLELWLKRQVKRATHWFTWEQVNFNSGAHHALRDARDALAAHEHALAALKADIFAVRDELREAVGQTLAAAQEDRARVAESLARLREETIAALERERRASGEELARVRAELNELRGGFGQLGQRPGALVADHLERLRARVEAAEDELRQRTDRLLEEQRVCFRQLSLETGETAVAFDRARRLLEARLEKLEAEGAPHAGHEEAGRL
jgi:predicted  nucleic acid-binding Zn-ribbon protein